MHGLQEAPENMLFCPTKICHLSIAACPAQNRDKACDLQVAKVMPRVVCTRIADDRRDTPRRSPVGCFGAGGIGLCQKPGATLP
jgi:hypothetical protein